MPNRTIVAIIEKDHENDETTPVLCYADEVMLLENEQVVANPTMTLEMLADFLDLEAEAGGSSSYGVHRLLAVLFYQALGRAQATELMKKIAEYGGLDGMCGADGEGDAFADLGVQKPWHSWSLPD
jgi:hypothetical protein